MQPLPCKTRLAQSWESGHMGNTWPAWPVAAEHPCRKPGIPRPMPLIPKLHQTQQPSQHLSHHIVHLQGHPGHSGLGGLWGNEDNICGCLRFSLLFSLVFFSSHPDSIMISCSLSPTLFLSSTFLSINPSELQKSPKNTFWNSDILWFSGAPCCQISFLIRCLIWLEFQNSPLNSNSLLFTVHKNLSKKSCKFYHNESEKR